MSVLICGLLGGFEETQHTGAENVEYFAVAFVLVNDEEGFPQPAS